MAKERDLYWGWYVVLGAFLILGINYGARYCFGVFVKPMSLEYHWSRSVISLGASVMILSYGIGGIMTGYLLDRMAPRRIIITGAVIAAVSGYCLGGGFLMATVAADYRVASQTALFGMPEVKIGITPAYGIPPLLAAYFPMGVVSEILLMGHNLPAEDACRFGYVNRVVPPEDLLAAAEAAAGEINELSPLVLRNIKQVLRTVTAPDPQGIAFSNAVCLMSRYSEDYIEGPRAFREKRKPVWKGR